MMDLIKTAGWLHLPLVLFHLGFWWIFGWEQDLANLTELNSGVVLHLHIATLLVLAFFGVVSLVYTRELVETRLGRSLLGFMAVFYAIRWVDELVIDGWYGLPTVVLLLVFGFYVMAYAMPLVRRQR